MYHGTDVIRRREIDWKACMVRIWEGLAHPQICMLYAQIGFSIDFYNSNLLSIESLDLRIGRSR
jgi:hypothetical protein